MRILHVITGLTTGGAEAVLYRLATASSGVEHEVICLEERSWYSDRLEDHGIRVHHLNWRSRGWFGAILRLRHLIRSTDADVVQTWMYRPNLFAGLLSRLAGKRVVWNIRCSTLKVLPPSTRALAYAGGFVARWVPDLIVNCSAVSRQLHARIGYDAAGGAVIPNGYDSGVFRPDDEARLAAREALGIDPDRFVVATIGRWHQQKGLPELLAAMRRLKDRGVTAHLLMVGRGLDTANRELAELIRVTGCDGLVQLIGERVDIPNVARIPDLHVLASIGAEGFPNAVAETMLSGTPNVVTDVGDAPLIVGDTGWIVLPGEAEKLATAIEQAYAEWATKSGRWQARRADARTRVAEKFTLARMVAAYEDVWRRAAPAPPLEAARNGRLRVLHIINGLTMGGAEALLYRLATRDTANDHVIVSLGRPAWYSSRLQTRGIQVHHLEIDSSRAIPKGVLRLKKIIRESGADVVQCWMYHSNFFGGLAAKLAGKPIVWGIHNTSLERIRPRSRAVVYLGGLTARWTPDFIVNCSNRSAELHAKLGYSAAAGAVVHNGYDASIWFPDESSRRAARKALKIAPRDFAIGSIARWDPLKDIPNLLAALRIAHDSGIPIRCFLMGAGLEPENNDFNREVRLTGCEGIVTPLGARSDLQELARAIDLHVLGSSTEAFPNVVAETMLSETPNVVTDVGDSAIMVGGTGWIVQPRSPQQLAEAIGDAYREWKEKPAQWTARRHAARVQIADNFSFQRMADTYRQIWKDVAAHQPVSIP